jgi:hypothetical protein
MNDLAHALGESKINEQIEKILTGLGFEPSDFANRQTSSAGAGGCASSWPRSF